MVATIQGLLAGLARALLQRGLIPEGDAERSTHTPPTAGRSFVEQLIQCKRFKELKIAEFAAETFGIPYIDLNSVVLEAPPLANVSKRFLQSHRALPLFLHRRSRQGTL